MYLFHKVSAECSRVTTERYSTSFSSAIKLLHKSMREPVCNIYGFVRFADEIVDSFHEYAKETLLSEYKEETYKAISQGISLNPILHSFQKTVNAYHIDKALIDAFFRSMETDLCKTKHDDLSYQEYIYGSAEVVGLMCLSVFCEGNRQEYEKLQHAARALGAAFQKVNFLRDVKSDHQELKRTYFPGVDFSNFSGEQKKQVEDDIARNFSDACEGILQLPVKARLGVYVAYEYYLSLFKKIRKSNPSILLQNRIRIPDYAKAFIVMRAGLRSQLNLL